MNREELELVVDEGLTQRQLADRFGVSHTTIRYWLGRFSLKTKTIRHTTRFDTDKYVQRVCRHHGETVFIYEQSKKGYRCKQCRSSRVSDQRRILKVRLVNEAGGKCQECGYSKSIRALQFHHRDPTDKTGSVSEYIQNRKFDLAEVEAKKCALLCANCHAEIEEQIEWASKPFYMPAITLD